MKGFLMMLVTVAVVTAIFVSVGMFFVFAIEYINSLSVPPEADTYF